MESCQRTHFVDLPPVGIKGVSHHAQLALLFKKLNPNHFPKRPRKFGVEYIYPGQTLLVE